MPLPRTLTFGASSHNARPAAESSSSLLAAALAAGLGSPVQAALSGDYDQLLEMVLGSGVDVAWLPPLLHAKAAERGARLVALPQRGGWLTFRSALLVRKDDPVRSAKDLRGARAAWRDRASASGYLFPRIELATLGAPPDKAFSSEKFYGSVTEAAEAVVRGDADLCTCFVSDPAAHDAQRAASEIARALGPVAAALRVLHVTDPIPPDGIVVSPRVTDAERDPVTAALLAFHSTAEGRKALEVVLQADRLAPVNDALMRSLKSWAQAAAARGA